MNTFRLATRAAAILLAAAPVQAADLVDVRPVVSRPLEIRAGTAPPGVKMVFRVRSDTGTVRFRVTGLPQWLKASPASGGATPAGAAVTISLNAAAARALPPGSRRARITFQSISDPDDRFVRTVQLDTFADPTGGALVYQRSCLTCHAIDTAGIGPQMKDVWRRKAGTHPDYANYSEALKTYGKPWGYKTLWSWTVDTQALVPGSRMPSFPSLSAGDRHALIGYLRAVSGPPLPTR